MNAESFLYNFAVVVQDFYKKITPNYVIEELLPSDPYVFHCIPVVFVAIYLFLLKFLPGFQEKYNILGTKRNKNIVFVAWNLGLTIYSGITFLYVFTWYIVEVEERGSFWEVYCPKTDVYFERGPNVFWYWTFAISKYFELFDTILLIIKNPTRKPMFLHWYHHATVVFATWWLLRYHYSPYFFGTMMNTFIHFNMYFYYALAVFFRPPWAFFLTVLQISQMVAGFVVYISWIFKHYREGCFSYRPLGSSIYIITLYLTYGGLFCQFFARRYFGVGKKKRKKKKKEDQKEE